MKDGIKFYHLRTFFRHQKHYLNNAVKNVWINEHQELVNDVLEAGDGLALAGDGRFNSVGHM